MHKSLCSCALVALLALAGAVAGGAQDEAFPLDEIEPGQRGYGLSVFQGTEPERFEFEVIGVWRNVQPDVSYILAEFSGQGLEETGVIAGMSGSPVYIDGRLVGAVSFSWPFSNRPVGGITPIESMRELLEAHRGPTSASLGIESHDLAEIVERRVDESKLIDALARLEPEPIGGARPGVQWGGIRLRRREPPAAQRRSGRTGHRRRRHLPTRAQRAGARELGVGRADRRRLQPGRHRYGDRPDRP